MTHHDLINAIFEGGGACFLCLNVRRLLKDKTVRGVSLAPSLWWTAWGFWNVYFYAAVSCSASFWAGIAVVSVQSVWVALAVHYARAARLLLRVKVAFPEPEPRNVRGGRGYLDGALGIPTPGCGQCLFEPDPCACIECWEKQGRP